MVFFNLADNGVFQFSFLKWDSPNEAEDHLWHFWITEMAYIPNPNLFDIVYLPYQAFQRKQTSIKLTPWFESWGLILNITISLAPKCTFHLPAANWDNAYRGIRVTYRQKDTKTNVKEDSELFCRNPAIFMCLHTQMEMLVTEKETGNVGNVAL